MKYLELTFITAPCTETVNDVLSAMLGEIGFDSFVEYNNGIKAYVQQNLFDETKVTELLENFPLADTNVTYEIQLMEDKDWNEEWEKNFFQPIVIGNLCVIHS